VAIGGVMGCSPFERVSKENGPGGVVLSYVKWRLEDLFESVDMGITVSEEPCGGIYGCGVSVMTGGWVYIDGHFIGIGGGQIGMTRFYTANVGLLAWGYEETGWQEFDKDDLSTLSYQGSGALGLLAPPYGRPADAPA